MDEEILSVLEPMHFSEAIAHMEIHAHQPYASSTFNNSDEIRIAVQNQDVYVLPSHSTLHIIGRLTKADGSAAAASTALVNHGICFLFEELRYELNGVEIDRNKHVGLTSLMKGYVSLTPSQKHALENAGWFKVEETGKQTDANGYFDVNIPLKLLLGFLEDYNKIVVNAKHELVLTRSNTDHNAIVQTTAEEYKLKLTKVEWLLPYVRASDQHRIPLLNLIKTDKSLTLSFRTWALYEYPMLPTTPKHIWTVKTSSQLEKPRYIILGFQTNRQNKPDKNASHFDHVKLRDVKLYLNSQCYPYNSLNLDITNNQFALLYDMYTRFQTVYYGKEAEPLLSKTDFLTYAPLVVIDCSKQNELLKTGPVDVRLEFESHENFPAETTAYCLILHDRVVDYSPLGGDVTKRV